MSNGNGLVTILRRCQETSNTNEQYTDVQFISFHVQKSLSDRYEPLIQMSKGLHLSNKSFIHVQKILRLKV